MGFILPFSPFGKEGIGSKIHTEKVGMTIGVEKSTITKNSSSFGSFMSIKEGGVDEEVDTL